jgi:CheY-like chemotaxis protein
VTVIAKPVLVVVDDEGTSLQALTRELESRYGAHYQVVPGASAEVALARLLELKAAGGDVPLVLADQRLPGMGGTALLARVREIFPTARHGLLISWADRAAPAPFLEAMALGWLEFYLNKPSRSPDEQFHRVMRGLLGRAEQRHAGVVHEGVESSQLRHRARDGGPRPGRVGHVGLEDQRPPAVPRNVLRHLRESFRAPGREGDGGPACG